MNAEDFSLGDVKFLTDLLVTSIIPSTIFRVLLLAVSCCWGFEKAFNECLESPTVVIYNRPVTSMSHVDILGRL